MTSVAAVISVIVVTSVTSVAVVTTVTSVTVGTSYCDSSGSIEVPGLKPIQTRTNISLTLDI